MTFDGLVKNVNNKVSKFLMYPRFLKMCLRMSQFGEITHTHTITRIAQSSVLSPVADEPVSLLRDVSQREACPTDSGFLADQHRATIAKSSTLPHDSAPRVTSPAAAEGRGNLDEGEEAVERVSDDTKEMATVLTSMDATTILASGAVEVPTGNGSIPTAVQEQIDAQVAKEFEEQLEREDQRMSEKIAKDAEVARIHVEEELQSMIDGLDRSNETVAKYLQEYQQFASELPLERRIELISYLSRQLCQGSGV
nr:hypothetical protein [Tanacetum cinerariifolium]